MLWWYQWFLMGDLSWFSLGDILAFQLARQCWQEILPQVSKTNNHHFLLSTLVKVLTQETHVPEGLVVHQAVKQLVVEAVSQGLSVVQPVWTEIFLLFLCIKYLAVLVSLQCCNHTPFPSPSWRREILFWVTLTNSKSFGGDHNVLFR